MAPPLNPHTGGGVGGDGVSGNSPTAPNSNKPFHEWLLGYGSVGAVTENGYIKNREVSRNRGYIRSDPNAYTADHEKTPERYLYFLYNPATISTGYAMQTDSPTTALMLRTGNGQADPLTHLQQSLDFALLFDRTFEVVQGDKEGAWKDVRAALALVGVMDRIGGNEQIYRSNWNFQTGPMLPRAMYFHFGNGDGGMMFYGMITSLSIEYTHFSRMMVPMRVGMRISAQLLPDPSEVPLWKPPSTSESSSSYQPDYSNITPETVTPWEIGMVPETDPYLEGEQLWQQHPLYGNTLGRR